jgi:FixJ family two-component response regulator
MSLGYAAETFSSAEAFLKSDRLRNTACLLTDLQMPGLNGLELQRRLIEQGSPLPVIFITAFPGAKVRAEALAAGALGFLVKPFNGDELVACLDAALASREA